MGTDFGLKATPHKVSGDFPSSCAELAFLLEKSDMNNKNLWTIRINQASLFGSSRENQDESGDKNRESPGIANQVSGPVRLKAVYNAAQPVNKTICIVSNPQALQRFPRKLPKIA